MLPLFSIITVVRNDPAGFAATATSVIQQSCQDLEWIVIDGASTDATPTEISKVRPRLSYYVSEPDRGVYDAMNKGLAQSTGAYVFFLNAGDTFAEVNTLAAIKTAITQDNQKSDFIYGDSYERLPAGGHFLKKARHPRWAWYGMFTHHQAMFYSRAAIAGLKYHLTYPIGADYAFTLEALKQSRSVLGVPLVISFFGPPGLSATQADKGRQDQYHIRRNILNYSAFSARAIFLFQKAMLFLRRRSFGLYALLRGYRPYTLKTHRVDKASSWH